MNETRYLTTAEMAWLTQMSEDFWCRVCASGAVPAIKLGNRWRVESGAFHAFMRSKANAPEEPDRRLSARQRRHRG